MNSRYAIKRHGTHHAGNELTKVTHNEHVFASAIQKSTEPTGGNCRATQIAGTSAVVWRVDWDT